MPDLSNEVSIVEIEPLLTSGFTTCGGRKGICISAPKGAAGSRIKELFMETNKAHRALNRAIGDGCVARPLICQQCGKGGRIEGHHADYAKPLDVKWLCVACHKYLHSQKASSEYSGVLVSLTPAISRGLDDMGAPQRSAVLKRASEAPQSAQAVYLKAACGISAPRSAIKAFCMMCVCWQRAEVTMCTSTACPLYRYRPFQDG